MLNALSIDVEEYFHPSEVQVYVDASQWESFSPRIEEQTRRILDLLAAKNTTATFFILGWVAEHHPHVVRAIADAGHEIACHSYAHRLVYELTPDEFRHDTRKALAAIEDACGIRPTAYRAPSYSIVRESLWALEILVQSGFTRDSSIFPVFHDRYGIPGFQRHAHTMDTPSGPIQEIPVATAKLSGNRIAPIGGGAYFRLLPYRYTSAGIRRLNQVERQPACFYFHPWEIDPDQPRLASGLISRVRTYSGVSGMLKKLDRLLTEFRFAPLGVVYGGQAGSLRTLHAAISQSG